MYSKVLHEAKMIYDCMADEESKDIFRNRLLFSVTNDWHYARNIVGKYLQGYDSDRIFMGMEENIAELRLEVDKKYIIYGAGMFGRSVLQILQKKGMNVLAFCDADVNKQREKYCGLNVVSPQQLEKYSEAVIMLAVWNQSKNIRKQLCSIGVKAERIVDCLLIEHYVDKNQYFDNEIVRFKENEVFLDCGCFDFETAQIFSEKCPDYKKIICFEPNANNQKMIQQKISQLSKERVDLIPYGVWSKRDILYFDGSGSSAMVSDSGKEKVEVIAIDEVIKEEVTFIKMDIEGSELNALKGAAKIIKNYKPRLAICVYHKLEDILEIPAYILGLVPEYKLYLRHYSNYFATETVLYAI